MVLGINFPFNFLKKGKETDHGKWRAVVPIVLALIVAVVASYFIYKYVKKQVAPKEVAKMEEVKIRQAAIAMVELPAGTQLKPDMIKTVSFLEETLPPGSFSSSDKLIGRVVITPTKSKELILESKLAPVDVTRGGGVSNFKARETRDIYKRY